MIAFDTNLLVYAHRSENPWHKPSLELLQKTAESTSPWGIPWSCVHEFLNIVTNLRIFKTPSPLPAAMNFIHDLMESHGLIFLAEEQGYFDVLMEVAVKGKVHGPMIHDARIAALCLYHGVEILYSADRDFNRFPDLRVVNPLVG